MAKKSGKTGARNLPDSSGQSGVVPSSNGRMAMGTSGYVLTDDPSSKDFAYGLTGKPGYSKGGNLDGFGMKANRAQTLNDVGARHSITVKLAGGPNPELTSLTQGNGRIVRPAIMRSRMVFDDARMGDTTGGYN